jgi:hypothetical protein
LRAYLDGDRFPLVRLMAENRVGAPATQPRPAATSSIGLLVANLCADEPQPFDLHAPLAVQESQLDAARRLVHASTRRTFLPFTPTEALPDVNRCLGWPAPTNPPPQSQNASFPGIPTLVLEGALDSVTPPPQARAVARSFHDGRYVEVPFVGHIAAVTDHTGCAASIAARFLDSATIDTACLSHLSALPQVDVFPSTFAHEPPVTPIASHRTTDLSADELRTIAIARDAVADVLWRWDVVGVAADVGLRGGSFTTIAPQVRHGVILHLDAVRWTADSTVTGDLNIIRGTHPTMAGAVIVSTPTVRARLEIRSSNLLGPSTSETITGTVQGKEIDVKVDAKLGLF